MRRIVFKNWPYPSSVKAMLLRVGNPIHDGNGNWHTDVVFKSFDRKDESIPQDWGLLPILKPGQIFSDGSKIGDNRNLKVDKFTFDREPFRFFIDQIKNGDVIIERPAFHTKVGGIFYNIPLIEVVRCFFARTRKIAYALLELNSILSLCQYEINEDAPKSVVVHFAPDCPKELTSERWLPMFAWMASDKLAQKSWDSFHRYFRDYQGENVVPRSKEEAPLFPLKNPYSLECGYRSYGNTVWIEEIKSIECSSLDIDEIAVIKYILGHDGSFKPRVDYIRQTNKIEITSLAGGALKSHVTVEIDLPGFTLPKTPSISVIKKLLGTGVGSTRRSETNEDSITVTGKNDGFIKALLGIEFSTMAEDQSEAQNDNLNMPPIPGLKEVDPRYLRNNETLPEFLEVLQLLRRKREVVGIGTKIYQLPGDSQFSWISEQAKRCCAVTAVKLLTNRIIYIIEVDRTIYGLTKRWTVATILVSIREGEVGNLKDLVNVLAKSGHWEEAKLKEINHFSTYQRLRHNNENDKARWAIKILNMLVGF